MYLDPAVTILATVPEPTTRPTTSRGTCLAHLAAGRSDGILPQVKNSAIEPNDRLCPTPSNSVRVNGTAESPVQLRASGLKMAFGGQVVLDGIDLELRRGEVVLLRGENGSGKTTLLNILTGNLEPDAALQPHIGMEHASPLN